MRIRITAHARERMAKYGLGARAVREWLEKPDLVAEGREGRKIAQKRLNGYVARIVYEEAEKEFTIITAYKARRERYEI